MGYIKAKLKIKTRNTEKLKRGKEWRGRDSVSPLYKM
jgi:hypothetical protein